MAKSAYTLEDALAANRAESEGLKAATTKKHQRMQSAYDQMLAEEEAAKIDEAKNWMDEAVRGASVGASMTAGNPWGALAGGIVGTIAGQLPAIEQNMKEGNNFLTAFGRTQFGGIRDSFRPETMKRAAGVGMAVGGKKLAQKYGGAEQASASDWAIANQPYVPSQQAATAGGDLFNTYGDLSATGAGPQQTGEPISLAFNTDEDVAAVEDTSPLEDFVAGQYVDDEDGKPQWR